MALQSRFVREGLQKTTRQLIMDERISVYCRCCSCYQVRIISQENHHHTEFSRDLFLLYIPSAFSVCAELQDSQSDLTWVSKLPCSQKNCLQYKFAYWTSHPLHYAQIHLCLSGRQNHELQWKTSKSPSIETEWKNKFFVKKWDAQKFMSKFICRPELSQENGKVIKSGRVC